MAKKKEKSESVTVLMMGCNNVINSINESSLGEEFTGTILCATLKDSLAALQEGDLDYTSSDPADPGQECDAVYEVTIKKLGDIGSAVHLIK